jgi:hypothetical protein
MASNSVPGRRCDEQYSSTLKWITIEPADTVVPMAISARQRLRRKKSLKDVSTVGGQDHTLFSQKIFDVSMAQVESVVEPGSIWSNIEWESVTLIGIHWQILPTWDS